MSTQIRSASSKRLAVIATVGAGIAAALLVVGEVRYRNSQDRNRTAQARFDRVHGVDTVVPPGEGPALESCDRSPFF